MEKKKQKPKEIPDKLMGLFADELDLIDQIAESAMQARSKIVSRRPDLIILDIMMPEVDGLQFCHELRDDLRYRTLPILFLSARWQTEDIVAGLDAGGDDYLTKPFELKELNEEARFSLFEEEIKN